jgi:hypothetical protein
MILAPVLHGIPRFILPEKPGENTLRKRGQRPADRPDLRESRETPMPITRRDSAKLFLAAAGVTVLPGFAAAKSQEHWAARLQEELNRHLLPGCDATLTLTAFGMGRRGGKVGMAAVIRLDWPPGNRQRRFDATETGEDRAFERILNTALLEFAAAYPACVV